MNDNIINREKYDYYRGYLEYEKFLEDVDIHFFFKDEDSIVPYLNIKNNNLMFRKNGIDYFLSSVDGHIAYRKRSIIVNDKMTYTWQISKREFINAVKWMM